MSANEKSSLKEMYQNLFDEAEEVDKKIKENLIQISEIDEYLGSIYAKEDADFKVFSPWNVESIYKEDIGKHKAEKYELENNNKYLYSRSNKLHAYLDELKDYVEKKVPSADDSLLEAEPITTEAPSKKEALRVLDIQEKERQRIARDLHDTSLQNLAHIVHKVELAALYMDKDVLQAKLELAAIKKNLKAVIEEMRNTVFDLRPMHFDDLGLKEAFEHLFVKLKEANTAFDFETRLEKIDCDDDLILMTIFRLVQEACSNAIKHSGGSKIKVVVEQKGKNCNILIRDNGSGFSVKEVAEKGDKHFGISVMKERVRLLGGGISFEAAKGGGTEIKMNIPLK